MKRIGTVTGNHHAAHCLNALFVETAAPRRRTNIHKGNILNLHRHIIANRHNCLFQIGNTFDVAQSTHQIFSLIYFDSLCTNIQIAFLNGIHNVHYGNIKCTHCIWVNLHLIFLHVAAHRTYFRNTFGRSEGIFHLIVLNGAQLVRIPSTCRFTRLGISPLQCVPKYLSQCRGIRSQSGLHILRKCARGQRVEFLKNARATPVKLHIIFEDDIYKRHTKHRRAANSLHSRNAQQRCGKGIGNLLLNIFWRASHPFGCNYLLIFANVGYGIHRHRVAWKQTVPLKRRCRHSPHHNGDEQQNCYQPVFKKIVYDLINHI